MKRAAVPSRFLPLRLQGPALVAALSLAGGVGAVELGLDLGPAGSRLSTGWGLATHAQTMFTPEWGLDLGYRYQSKLEYDRGGSSHEHRFSQFETGLIWQQGNRGARFQAIGGAIFAGYGVEDDSGDLTLDRFTPGYRFDADISVPVFTRFRVFANAGYQGFYSDGMPDQWRWRYGVRMTFGSEVTPLERDEQARLAAEQAAREAERTNPSPRIDPDVPQYMPRHLSQSLPPIVELSEVCKCFPAGPYTLQLGEFRSMDQAVRAMEYRGLRQFFNTVAYEREPLPVFLAQVDPDGAVLLFVGEFETLDRIDFWKRQLRRSGVEGRLRKVIGSEGRVANRIAAVPELERSIEPQYTDEEVRRMNSLPGDQPAMDTAAMNQAEPDTATRYTDSLVVGPVRENQVRAWLEQPAYRDTLLRTTDTAMPGRQRLVWEATRQEGWLYLDGFADRRQLDQWRAWLERRDLVADHRKQATLPVGDIYIYHLGSRQTGHTLLLDAQPNARAIMTRMTAPEVLWFQAYQAINDQPPTLSVNWSANDGRYHLVATGFSRRDQVMEASRQLSNVGLLPKLME